MATKLENLTTKLQSALDAANALPDAITLDELTNPGSAATMLEGTEMLDADGKKVTGTIASLSEDDVLYGGGTVGIPAGYYPNDFYKTEPDVTFNDVSIKVKQDGLVDVDVTVATPGYMRYNREVEGTLQLPTQAAKTITPTKSSQTAVEAGKYTTGAVTVGAIPDEYADVSKVSAYEDIVVRGYSFVDKNGNTSYGNLDISDAVQIRAYGGEVIENFTVSTSLGLPLDDNDASHIAFDALLIGNVSPEHVLEGETFTSFRCDSLDGPITGGFKQTGTMPNNGSMSKTIDGLNTKSATIPAGSTSGGTVSLASTIDDTADSQAAQIAEIKAMLSGKSVSGGSQTYETCAVTVNNSKYIGYTGIENGSLMAKTIEADDYASTFTFDAVQGTLLVFEHAYTYSYINGAMNQGHLMSIGGTDYGDNQVRLVAVSGDTMTITCTNGASGGSN